jgi:hypothetical protein
MKSLKLNKTKAPQKTRRELDIMKIKKRKVIVMLVLLTCLASISIGVHADDGIRRYYGPGNQYYVEGKIMRTGERASASTTTNYNTSVSVSLYAEFYLQENKNETTTKYNGTGGTGGVSIRFSSDRGFYCNFARSTHACSYFGFNETLSDGKEN